MLLISVPQIMLHLIPRKQKYSSGVGFEVQGNCGEKNIYIEQTNEPIVLFCLSSH